MTAGLTWKAFHEFVGLRVDDCYPRAESIGSNDVFSIRADRRLDGKQAVNLSLVGPVYGVELCCKVNVLGLLLVVDVDDGQRRNALLVVFPAGSLDKPCDTYRSR